MFDKTHCNLNVVIFFKDNYCLEKSLPTDYYFSEKCQYEEFKHESAACCKSNYSSRFRPNRFA